jgi:hypothetical protein
VAPHRLVSITVGVPNVEETAQYYAEFGPGQSDGSIAPDLRQVGFSPMRAKPALLSPRGFRLAAAGHGVPGGVGP